MKAAIVTGVTGQDGAYLTRHLLRQGYRVFGAFRRSSSTSFWRLAELGCDRHERLELVDFDVTDMGSCLRLVEAAAPDEVYNLAAQSFVKMSFEQPRTTADSTALGALNLLEAVRSVKPDARFYQASTSEMFGLVDVAPQNETTAFHPRSPYAIAKLYAHWTTVNYREAYGLFASSGILFNHESPLRGLEFVTRKITDGVARIAAGESAAIELGNLDAKRDWGYAAEYVEGMWRMLQADSPGDYVLATGRSESVRRFVELAFQAVGVALDWRGSGVDECGTCAATGRTLVRVNPKYYRPAEVEALVGDCAKARQELGWQAGTSLETLCAMMVAADLRRRGVPHHLSPPVPAREPGAVVARDAVAG